MSTNPHHRNHKSRSGFTLVEVMVVVLILGILLSIAATQFQKARERSQATACQHNLKTILGAKERWAMDHSREPEDTPTMEELAEPGVYMRGTPQCPTSGRYTIGQLNQLPTCSIGGTPGTINAHLLH
jgi:prepilin-type N-terminal cleavage/methylation domain-containing protein